MLVAFRKMLTYSVVAPSMTLTLIGRLIEFVNTKKTMRILMDFTKTMMIGSSSLEISNKLMDQVSVVLFQP